MSAEPKIFFINKTAKSKSLSRSSGSVRSRIFSHVQGRDRPVRNSTQHELSIESGSRVNEPEERSSHANTPVKNGTISDRAPPILRSQLSYMDVKILYAPAESASYYFDTMLKSLNNVGKEHIFQNRSVQKMALSQIISLAAMDPMVFSALLCTVSCASNAASRNSQHTITSTALKDYTIRQLQVRLAIANSPQCRSETAAAYAISLLIWAECLDGTLKGVKSHMMGLDCILQRIGATHIFPQRIMINIITSSYMCSALLCCPPTIPPPSFGMIRTDFNNKDVIDKKPKLGARFFQTHISEILGSDLLVLISRRCGLLALQNLSESTDSRSSFKIAMATSDSQSRWEHDVLAYQCDPNLSPWQKAVYLALFAGCQHLVKQVRFPTVFGRIMSQRLLGYTEAAEDFVLHSDCNELMLWLFFMAAYLSCHDEGWEKIAVKFKNTCYILGLDKLPQVHHVLDGFFFFFFFFSQYPGSGEILNSLWLYEANCAATGDGST